MEEREDRPPVTILTGRIADQAALRGVLTQIFDLNLALISVFPAHRIPANLSDTVENNT